MIVINGYYGAGNFGDDIILLSIIYSIRDCNIEDEICVVAINEDKVPKNCENITVIKRSNIEALIKKIQDCDLLITGGGGIFQDYSGFDINRHILKRDRGIDFYTVPVETAYIMEKPIMVYAVGVGPIKDRQYERFFKWILNLPNIITVRDKTSLDLINQIESNCDVRLTADPAVNFMQRHENYKTSNSEYKGCIGVCLRDWFLMKGKDEYRFIEELSRSIDYIIEKYNLFVVLFPFCTSKKDKILIEKVYANVEHKEKIKLKLDINMDEALEIISNIEILIGMRLHSIITASSIGIPVIGINYDDKIKEYMESLNMGNFNINLEDIDYKTINIKIDELIFNYYSIFNKINKNIKKLKETEKENIEIFKKLLSGELNE